MELRDWIADRYQALEGIDYYRLLGVDHDVVRDEVKASYYRLAERLHPDRYGDGLDDESRRMLVGLYSRVVEAYRVLIDARKRGEYDRLLEKGKLRWLAEDVQRKEPEAEIQSSSGRRFFKLGRAAFLSGDLKNAIVNLRFALDVEPGSELVRAELAKAEAAIKERGG